MKLLRPALGFLTAMTLAFTPAVSPVGPFVDSAEATNPACSPTESTFVGGGGIGVEGVEYTVLQFTSVGTCDWNVPSGVSSVDYLIVAGGGGGSPSGGGGAGGLLEGTASSISGTVSIVVGAGGAGGAGQLASSTAGSNGGESSVFGKTAIGGGGAGAWDYSGVNAQGAGGQGRLGGSGGGGGAANDANAGGSGTDGQGFAGGSNYSSASPYPGGGGGGAGDSGGNAGATQGGAGGDGKSSSITGSSVGYAGGGAGTSWLENSGSAGVQATNFGGGAGANPSSYPDKDGGAGADGKGGGGGGALRNGIGGAGGDGVVILRYVSEVGEILRLDATHPDSYSGSGTDWTDLAGSFDPPRVGALKNGVAPSLREKTFDFDGDNDFVELPSMAYDFSNGLSIHVVAEMTQILSPGPDTPRNFERLIDFGNGSPQENFWFGRSWGSNDIAFETFSGGLGTQSGYCRTKGNSGIISGVHTYSVVISSSGGCSLYRDGVQLDAYSTTNAAWDADPTTRAESATSFLPTSVTRTKNYVGRSNWSGDAYLRGSIQSVILYNSVAPTPTCYPVQDTYEGNGTNGTSGVTYTYFEFRTVGSCSWTPPAEMSTADVLVVGGGGGGAGNYTGGSTSGGSGGGGGVYPATGVPISGATTVTVGRGGSGGPASSTKWVNAGEQGGDSAFGALTSGGGGGGGIDTTSDAWSSGSTINGRNGTAAGNGGSPSNYWGAYSYGRAGTASSVTISGITFPAISGNRGGGYSEGSSTAGSSASAGGAGSNGTYNTAGSGVTSYLNGSTTSYGAGGASWNTATHTFTAPISGTGTGGDGARASGQASGLDGASGSVIVRYATAVSVAFASNGGSGSMAAQTVPVGTSTALSSNSFTRAGYTFAGWDTAANGSGTDYSDAQAVSLSQPLTLYAQWSANSLTVSWNSNGGSAVSNSTVNTGSTLSAPTPPTRAGYYFDGWSPTEGGSVVTFPYSHPNTSDFTMYAVWEGGPLLAYEPFSGTSGADVAGNSGSGSSGFSGTWATVNAVKQDSVAALSGEYVSLTGLGLPSNTGFSRPSANTGIGGPSPSTWQLRYTARELERPISFDSAGTYYYSYVLHKPGQGSAMVGLLSGLPANSSDDTEWSLFAGPGYQSKYAIDYGDANVATWVSGQSRQVASGYNYSAVSAGSTAITTEATAQFMLVKISTVGSGSDQVKLKVFSASDTLPIDDSAIAWDVSFSGAISGTANYVAVETEYSPVVDEFRMGLTYDSVTDPYLSVTWESNGGSSVSNSLVKSGGTLGAPAEPTRSGYLFSGWAATDGGSSVTFPYAHPNTANFTMYALWTSSNYTVSFQAGDDGSGSNRADTKVHGTALTLPNAATANSYFTRTGYAVVGWSTNSDGSTTDYALGASYTANSGITLYPVWNRASYTLSFDNNHSGSSSTMTYYSGDTITLPSPNRLGYTLNGWYTAASGGTKVGDAGATYSPLTSNGLILRYELDDPTSYGGSGTAVTDTSGEVNSSISGAKNATAVGGPAFSVSDGMYLEFDGVDDYLVTENLSDRVSGADVSLFAWIYPTDTGVIVTELGQTRISPLPNALIGWHDSQIEVVGSNLRFALWGGYANAISTPVTLNTWQYVGITYSGNTMRAYVDGTEVGSRTFARSAPKANRYGVHYGLGASDTTNLGDGTFGNFRLGSFHVYDSGLTASQVLDNYQATCARFDNSCTQRTLYAQWQEQGFAVTFSSGDNASGSDETQTKTFGVDYTIPNSATSNGFFSRAGYSITSWASNSDGSGSTYAFGATYSTDAALTLYPVWTPDTYTITFNKGSASGANGVNRSATKTHDSALTLPNLASPNMPYFTKTGYTITGWSTSADGSTSDFALGASYTTEGDATLYPVWTPDTYTVTYDYNGATGGNSTSTSSYTVDSIVVSLPNPTKTGYTFGGWYSDDITFSNSVGGAGESYTPDDDIQIYAKWNASTFTVRYEYNGATSDTSNTDDPYTTDDTPITLPTPSRDGYEFAGWYRDDVTFANSEGAGGASYEPTSNLTIYAKWTAVSRSVTYESTDKTGGSAPTDSDTYIIGDTVVVRGNTGLLVRTGYTFAGWTVASDGSGTVLNAGSTLTVSTSDISLYPKWTPVTYTITYNKNGGSGDLSSAPSSWQIGSGNVSLPNTGLSRTGFNFDGWQELGSTTKESFSYFPNYEDVTLVARWNVKSIAYQFDEGTAAGLTITGWPSDSAANFGSSITLPDLSGTTVTIAGKSYLFVGWDDGTNSYSSADQYRMTETSPTFTAQWAELFDVRYVYGGGTHSVAGNGASECDTGGLCVDGEEVTLRSAPQRPGYTFTGWEDQSGNPFDAGEKVNISSTSYLFYAQWQAITYRFSFNSAGGDTTPPRQDKTIGEIVTMPSTVPQKSGYSFAGWSPDGGTTSYDAGANYVVGTEGLSFVAQWIPDVYTVTYDWQGGASSTPKVSDTYTFASGDMSLPTASANGYTRDGYTFSGWSTSPTGSLETAFQPAADDVLYAIWADGNYTLSYNPSGGTIGSGTGTVPRTSTITLPTPVRDSFTFVGWYDAASGGNLLGAGGASFTPDASQTLYARWVQDSLYGVDLATLEDPETLIASNSVPKALELGSGYSSARVEIPAGALPNGTVVNVRYFKDTSRQSALISGDNNYFFSLLVSWLYGSGTSATVPDTAAGKPISVKLDNPNIKAGAMVYQVIGETVTELGRAVADGTVTVQLTEDPELVVAATKPDAPTAVSGSAGDTRATVSWSAGASGGREITSYTVTASPGGATCVTASTSCTISSLTNNTAYTFTVRATNAIGTSVASTASSAVTPVGANYTVTFDSNGGSSVSAGSFFSGSTVSAPSSPSRSGYTFQGWSTVLDDDSSEVTFPYAPGVTQAITLYALWEVAPASSSNRNPRAATPTIPTRPNLPIVIPPRATPQVVATPGPLEAPVIIPSAPPAPDKPTQASVGGRSVEVRTIQEGDSVKLSAGRVEVGLSVPTPSATSTVRPNASTSQPEIVVSPGDTARVDARGLLPGSSVQVWLPGADERELSRATVGPDGSVRADVSLIAPRGEKPIPIGPQVLQVTGFDEQGNQTVIDMTITIVQGAPAPELNREANALPDLQPGQTLATSAGSPEVVNVRADTDTREVSISTNEWSFKVSVPEESGTVNSADDQAPTIRLIQARTAEVNGEGFQPDTRVDVFLFSQPTLLGSFTVKADGTFDAEVFLDARFAVVGDHTLQIQGVGTDGYVKAANLGVLVEEPPAPTTASEASLMLWWVLAAVIGLMLLVVMVVWFRRSPRAARP